MSRKIKAAVAKQDKNEKRPDPLFKKLMTKVALAAGVEKGPTELRRCHYSKVARFYKDDRCST
ncbi:MAG: hypothetical protein WCS37_01555 [Chloroflexota bacterium]|nr:hypothetical protein [Chloroflexota bacterium]